MCVSNVNFERMTRILLITMNWCVCVFMTLHRYLQTGITTAYGNFSKLRKKQQNKISLTAYVLFLEKNAMGPSHYFDMSLIPESRPLSPKTCVFVLLLFDKGGKSYFLILTIMK